MQYGTRKATAWTTSRASGPSARNRSVDGGPHRVGDTRGPGRPRSTVDPSLPGELLDQERVPVAGDRNITATARVSAPQSRASSADSSSDSGPRCRVAHRGSRHRAETPSMARPCVSSRHVASSNSGTLSASNRKSRWRSRSIVAGSAHCRSSTNTTLGVSRVNSSTSRVSPSSWRVRCWSSGSAGSRPASDALAVQAAQERDVLVVSRTIGKSCRDLGEQGLAQRQIGQLEPFVRPARHDPEPRAFGDVEELLRETGLPDAAPTLDDDHLGVTPRTQVETRPQPVQLAAAADERERPVARRRGDTDAHCAPALSFTTAPTAVRDPLRAARKRRAGPLGGRARSGARRAGTSRGRKNGYGSGNGPDGVRSLRGSALVDRVRARA